MKKLKKLLFVLLTTAALNSVNAMQQSEFEQKVIEQAARQGLSVRELKARTVALTVAVFKSGESAFEQAIDAFGDRVAMYMVEVNSQGVCYFEVPTPLTEGQGCPDNKKAVNFIRQALARYPELGLHGSFRIVIQKKPDPAVALMLSPDVLKR